MSEAIGLAAAGIRLCGPHAYRPARRLGLYHVGLTRQELEAAGAAAEREIDPEVIVLERWARAHGETIEEWEKRHK